jgi:hypothetical protein
MGSIPDNISDMLIGIVGTVLYLYTWTRILQRYDPDAKGLTPHISQAYRWRRRLWQTLLFLFLTPYVLMLFALMEKAHAW